VEQIFCVRRLATLLPLLGGEEETATRLRKLKGRKIDGITLRQKAEKCKILATNCGKSDNARYCLLTGTMI